MKNPKIFSPLSVSALSVLAATVLATGAASTRVWAQNAPVRAVPQKPTDIEQWQQIRLRNVSPDFMAYWLDARNHTLLEPYQGVKPTWAIGKTGAEAAEMLSLPAGVSAVAPVGRTNSLWVLGTEAGVQKLVEKIALLDKSVKQVEVEAQCIQISAADAKTLGVTSNKSEGKIGVGVAGANIQDQIAALVAQKRAKIITAPRVTALFGSKSSLFSTASSTLAIDAKNQSGIKIQPFANAILAQKAPYDLTTTTSIGFSVLPTFNLDGTLSLQMGPLRTLNISTSQPGTEATPYPLLRHTSGLDLDGIPARPITLKDGQTAVLQGFRWPISSQGNFNALNYWQKTPTSNVIVLVTPRVLRRADDEVRTAALPR